MVEWSKIEKGLQNFLAMRNLNALNIGYDYIVAQKTTDNSIHLVKLNIDQKEDQQTADRFGNLEQTGVPYMIKANDHIRSLFEKTEEELLEGVPENFLGVIDLLIISKDRAIIRAAWFDDEE